MASDTHDHAALGEAPNPSLVSRPSTQRGKAATGRIGSYVFVLPWEPNVIGGVSGVVRNLAKAMLEGGSLTPTIAINSWDDPRARQSADSVKFRFSLFGAMTAVGVLKAIVTSPLCLWRTYHLLRECDARAVNFHFPGIAPFGVAVLKRLGAFRGKLILSYHGTDVAAPAGLLERRIHAFVVRSADHLVACSHALASRLASQIAVPDSRVEVIANGVDASVFDGIGKPGTILPQPLPSSFIVSVGAFIARKNHLLLLRAFALLKDRYPALHLCIAGADGDEREAVEREIRRQGAAGRVHLLLELDQFQVALLLSKATLCIQTSLAESFPLAVLEASSSGIPLVVSDIPGHQEMVRSGSTGTLFPLDDPAACADAIVRVLDQPEASARMAATLRARVRRDFTWASCMRQYERLVGPA